MAKFLNELDLVRTDTGFVLNKPFVYQSSILKDLVVVPEGFQTDFASIPKLPGIYLVFDGTADRPAVVHDFLYSLIQADEAWFSRETADRVFLEAMEVDNVVAWKRWVMFFAVRVFGGLHLTVTSN